MWVLRFSAGSKKFEVELDYLAGLTAEGLLRVMRQQAESHDIAPEAVSFDNLLLYYVELED